MKSDVELQQHVLEELDWEPSIEASQIGVTSRDGVVTLTGHVATHTEKHTAEEVTRRVHGTRAVANDIEVRPGEHHHRDDEEIAGAAVHNLKWAANVPEDRVQVVVRDRWLTLEGTVDERFQREAAERAIRHLLGIRGVTNNLLLRARPGAARPRGGDELQTAIEDALRRSAIVNADQITVDVDQDTVVLTGDVRSHSERDEVERIAWKAREVSRVENCITITPWGSGVTEEWGY